ncbi:DUF5686 and carboxypeptidase regulatory-like domain-containing protein [Flavobacterium sp.]|uniref:DUF5686 and carboxypeptidase regulatory-like domain-containing protein n=1 Tax=Flavobacterium sp. TaxID=239 RepID=UPI0035277B09
MKQFFAIAFLFFSIFLVAQIKGKVTDAKNNPLPFVNIYIENTYSGTTTNEFGVYELNYFETNEITVVFKYLGYKTQKHTVNLAKQPYVLNVVLEEESYNLNELLISNADNPANQIIRKAIASKKKNTMRTDKFEADFYSKGIFRVKDMPKKILGQEVGDLDGNIDSTGSGVIYLSETVSKIKFEKPNKLREEIIASKVAGNDNGFSFNTALDTDFDFYNNYVAFNINMISPLANNAFSYYKFSVEGTFYDDNNQLINKIKLTPKRDKEPVFEGFIYIVENSWAIYGVDVAVKGYRMQQPVLETLQLVQNYSYNENNKLWIKNVQSLDFKAGFLGINFTGKFTHVFSNYQFKDAFENNTFGKEIISFDKNANKKENSYWEENRQIPLTEEEVENYHKKDSIQTLRSSQVYLDSIDKKNNKFKPFDIISGYSYKNSYKKWRFNYEGLLNFSSINYNTVQGWNLDSGFSFTKYNEENRKYTRVSSTFNYGFSEDRLRVTGQFYHRFNGFNRAYINAEGGSAVSQFNKSNPISNFVNTISTLFFKDNYIKLYNKEFVSGTYGQEVVNGIFMSGNVEYEKRKPLFNTTTYVFIKNDDAFLSNNPLEPYNYNATPFATHYIMKASVRASFSFNQKYISRPDGKFNISDSNYPKLSIGYTKAFAATESNYQYDYINATATYDKTFGNKGTFSTQLNAGKFFNADAIAFIDYKHFNGNQTHVNFRGNYLNSYSLLPYYSNSTNDAYLEMHFQHNFNGFIMNKIPLLNKLQWNLIGGFHQINVPNYKPYQEFSVGFNNIGFGKFRFLRIDYVRAYQNGYLGDGLLFGISF